MTSLPPAPAGFRGTLHTDAGHRSAAAGSRGPIHRRPAAVLRPAGPDDVPLALAWATEAGLPLTPRGGGTGMPGGNVGTGAILDLSALAEIGAPDPATAEVVVGAGAVGARVEARCREHGRRLPALPSSADWCTVGGMVACNAAGAASFRFGSFHRRVVDLEVVGTDGRLAWLGEGASASWGALHSGLTARPEPRPAWPGVRKNSSGYALDRFLEDADPAQLVCGSEGTLAVVTRARLRTDPPAEGRAVVLVGVPTPAALPEVAAEAEAARATACEYVGRRLLDLAGGRARPWIHGLDSSGGVALVELEGPADEVAAAPGWGDRIGRSLGGSRTATRVAEIEALWALRHAASPTIARAAAAGVRSLQFMEDAVVPLAALPSYLTGVEGILARHGTEGVVFGHAGDGNLHVNPLVDLRRPDWRERVRSMLEEAVDLVVALGGTLSGEHGDGRLRAPYLERVWGRSWTAAFRAVKQALDPRGLLNPGVILPLPGQDPLAGLAEGPDLQVVLTGAGDRA